MNKLNEKKCKPCEGDTPPLSPGEARDLLQQVPGWEITADGKALKRQFQFKGFYRTMAFVNALAWVANQENHHPDFTVGYNYCHVLFTTHAADGLTENDFICAAKVNALFD